MIQLKGMAWQSRRALDPLVASLSAFRALHPDIDITWTARTLAGFEFEPVEKLARDYDLIILDHPFMGDAARKGYLLGLEETLTGKDGDYIGPSLATYRFDGATYAVPVDAASAVAVYRPDLMNAFDKAPPKTWPEVLALGQDAARQGLNLAIGLMGVHSLMAFLTLMAGIGKPCGNTPDEPFCDRATAREALSILRALVKFCPPQVFEWNSIALHEKMVAEDRFVYCPSVYCYATYAEADQRRPLRFADLPGLVASFPMGSAIGGTGLAVSAHCKAPEAARCYAAFAASASTQLGFGRNHGQPARIEAWTDAALDQTYGGFFSATRASFESCWVRPRYAGYLGFQERGGQLVESHLRGALTEEVLLARLQDAFAASGSAT